jgi:hypothetical protein
MKGLNDSAERKASIRIEQVSARIKKTTNCRSNQHNKQETTPRGVAAKGGVRQHYASIQGKTQGKTLFPQQPLDFNHRICAAVQFK